MKPKKYSYPENRNMQGGINRRGHHGTRLEMIWTNAGHAQIAVSGSSCGGLHDKQARHEESGICAR